MYRRFLLATVGAVLFAGSLVNAQQIERKGAISLAPSNPQNVKVVNTSAEAVPVTVNGTPTVQVGNSSANPVLIRNIDTAARQPYHATISAPFVAGNDVAGSASSLVVPAGKRLVIKYVSADADVPVGQVVVGTFLAGRPELDYVFVLSRQASGNGFDEIYAAAQPMEIWLDPGDLIDMIFVRNGTLGTGNARVTISGYLENVP